MKNMTKKCQANLQLIAFLEKEAIFFKLKFHENPVYTSEDAARERGVRLSQIVKTMILKSSDGGAFVAVLPGDKRLNLQSVKKLIGKKDLSLMAPEAVAATFGLTVGAIAPIGNALAELQTYIDPSVFTEEFVDISSGHPEAGIELKSSDLKRLLRGAAVHPIAK